MESTNDFCYAEFLAYYTFESKSNNTCDYQPHELHDNLIENNHQKYFYSKQIKLMNSGEKMRCLQSKKNYQYHVPNEDLWPEIFAEHVILFFYSSRDEKELSSGFPPTYQNKLPVQGVEDVVNINKIKF